MAHRGRGIRVHTALFRGRPLPCPDEGQTRAVEHEMEALAWQNQSQTCLKC